MISASLTPPQLPLLSMVSAALTPPQLPFLSMVSAALTPGEAGCVMLSSQCVMLAHHPLFKLPQSVNVRPYKSRLKRQCD